MTTPPQNGVQFRLGRIESDLDRLGRRIESVADIVARRAETVAEIRATLENARIEARQCNENVRALDEKLDQREETKRTERRQDRRFLVGTVVSAAGIIIAALALLINAL